MRVRISGVTHIMRITIIHNPGSGEGSFGSGDLVAAAREHGHQVTFASTEDADAVAARLAEPTDLVVVSGGDGTVRNVLTRLIGRDVPATLVPAGTANNIARTIGLLKDPRELIAGWSHAETITFDTGIVRGVTGPLPLIEGTGFGPIAVTIAALSSLTDAEAKAEWIEQEVRRDLKVLREVLADYPLHDCRVNIDGRDLSGRYLLVEVMNIRSVGPTVELAPGASVSDGLFDIVLLGEEERAVLRDYLTARIDGGKPILRVPTHRGRHVKLAWRGSRVHIDDQVWPREEDAASGVSWGRDGWVELEVLMNPAALPLLIPRSVERSPASQGAAVAS
jgi:diacylglycerol kinase family enzyme